MLLHRGPTPGGDPALELAVAHALVRRASEGEVDEVLRIHRPSVPVAAFGRREVRLDGFRGAADAVRRAGFVPAIRATGGRAVAFTDRAIVVDHVAPDPDAAGGLDHRFQTFGRMLADAFRDLGVDARMGAVPGEYCPGPHSVNARGVVKLVGTAQRVVRRAWLFSSLVIVGDAVRIRPLLTDIYGRLDQDFDGASVGSLSGESPDLDLDTVEEALLAAYAGRGSLDPAPLEERTLERAMELHPQHRVEA
ncbi:MAG TPA: lipoate--protein ligase [Nocardioides sp.]|uniref:lipoate--protein ligase family protein n=1 Tax=Nocardioides sp. TaxID=35761 RepID=UPI002D7F4362|nr:lipoate--protein ligase [Nocardioides sp.]HET6651057.1 lipoate--protein ligase [Nocardioides sp.]